MTPTTVPGASDPPLRLALVQYRPTKASPDHNLGRIRTQLVALGDSHDLVVYPEAALSGYFLEGGVGEAARSSDDVARGLGPCAEVAPDVVVGFFERWRRRLYNSVGYFEATPRGYRTVHVHRKLFLPSYGVFDEDRFVDTGREVAPLETRFGRIGLLVCEDLWHALPATVLALGGAELLLVVSASPARDFGSGLGEPANLGRWTRLATSAAEEHGIFVAVSQLVGSEGGKLFSGGSLVVAPDGEVLARGPLFDEAVVAAQLHGVHIERTRADSPLLADLELMLPHLQRSLRRVSGGGVRGAFRGEALGMGAEAGDARQDSAAVTGAAGLRGAASAEAPAPVVSADPGLLDLDLDLVEAALVRFIRDEVVVRRGFERVVLGVSGGVDSAVSLYLACRALGPDNVHGLRLPYATSSADSLAHADRVLEATGAQARTVEITGPVDAYLDAFEPDADGVRRGNVMARTRAVILFDQSARLRALPLGTGNKSERLLGYFTWHADDAPPINPLGDLFKTQVWALARHLGVPAEIVDKPASADLVQGVHDQDELGIGYAEADPILFWLVRGYAPDDLVRSGFDADRVEVVQRRLSSTHWKRELPTVAVLSSSAIGAFYLRPVDY